MNQPVINVTPLIDVLLVLLIIFMVVIPSRPHGFKTRIPSEAKPPQIENIEPNPKTIIVTVSSNGELKINKESIAGTLAEPDAISSRLTAIFAERIANSDVSESFADDAERPYKDRVERTVFVKAKNNVPYGTVVRAIDIVKTAGAYPVSLQIDNLSE